jgi:post-segregation antitoxin (ccd killing protein)
MVKDEMNNRREKTTVTIPRWLKEAAEAEGINYSRLLETAIKEPILKPEVLNDTGTENKDKGIRYSFTAIPWFR